MQLPSPVNSLGALLATVSSSLPLLLVSTASAQTFTVVQQTPLPPSGGNWLADSVAYVPSLDHFFVFNGANVIRELTHSGAQFSAFGVPGAAYFSQSGMTTDPVTGDLLFLQDVNPGGFGSGTVVRRIDPVTRTNIAITPFIPMAEPTGLAINPSNGNWIISDVFGFNAGQGRIREFTPAGVLVRTVVSPAQLLGLGLGFYADSGLEVFPPTGELIFGSGSSNRLYAVDLATLDIRPFLTVQHGVSGIAFSPSGDEMALINYRTLYLYSGNSAPTVDCALSGDFECIAPLATVSLSADVADADGDEVSVSWSVDGVLEQQTVVSAGTSPVEVVFTHNYGNLGAYTVEVTVDDGFATTSCTIDVTIVDETNPTAICSMDMQQGTDEGTCEATLASLSAPAVSDNCGVESVTNDAPAGLVFPVGSTVVTWTVTDVAGHIGTCEQVVTVEDDEQPVVECGPPIELNADADSNVATWTLDPPTAADNCGVVSLTSNYPDPTFPIGNTPVVWTATDAAGNEGTCIQVVTVNARPVADAGADFSVNEGQTGVMLDGSGSSDLENDPLTYSWAQVPMATVTLSDAAAQQPTFDAPFVALGGETLTFELTVTANGTSDTDEVNVTVVNVNHPPVALAGDDQSIAEGAPVTLNGTDSFDIDNDPFTYSWVQVSGSPAVTLTGATTATPSFTAPLVAGSGSPGVVATLVFELTVDDDFLPDAPAPGYELTDVVDSVTIEVTNVNNAPIANAGVDQTLNEAALVTLNGSLSSDPDSDDLSYSWMQTGGPTATLSDPSSATPSFTAPFVMAGGLDLTFELLVDDSYAGGLATDTVVIHLQNANDPPLVSAAKPSIGLMWPPNHGLVSVSILCVSDPEDNATITIDSVTQDEPTNGLGDGDTAIDAFINADGTVLLRAERAGGGDGRVYHIHFTASDLEGSASGVVTVTVPKKKKDAAVDGGELYSSTN